MFNGELCNSCYVGHFSHPGSQWNKEYSSKYNSTLIYKLFVLSWPSLTCNDIFSCFHINCNSRDWCSHVSTKMLQVSHGIFFCTFQPPRFSFYNAAKPMYTSRRNLPPTKIDNSKVRKSLPLIWSWSFQIEKTNLSIAHNVFAILWAKFLKLH